MSTMMVLIEGKTHFYLAQLFKIKGSIILRYCSLLVVESADRPGLLVDLVKIITDINIAVESGEFDTEVKFFS